MSLRLSDIVKLKNLAVLSVSAAGLIGVYYYTVYKEKRIRLLEQKIAMLDIKMLEMEKELIALRALVNQSSATSSRRKTVEAIPDCSRTDDFMSVLPTDDEEYYDLSDEEDLIGAMSNGVKKPPGLFDQIDTLLQGSDNDKDTAFNLLKDMEHLHSENVDFLYRMAKSYRVKAAKFAANKNEESKKAAIEKGLEYATKALEIDDKVADAHKWFAILTGMKSEYLPTKEKIQSGHKYQEHVMIAVKLKPDDYSLHHLLGRFKLEMCKLSWIEKKVASTLFGELPTASFEDALSDFLKAEKLNPNPWKENKLHVALSYIGAEKYPAAVTWLLAAKQVPTLTVEDEVSEKEIDELLVKYKRYT